MLDAALAWISHQGASPLVTKLLRAMRKRTVLGGPRAAQFVSAASLPGRWLGYACPDLGFGQAIAAAIPCAPARRPDSPIPRHRPASLVKYPG